MAQEINNWKIVKGIISECNSKHEIEMMVKILENSLEREELIRILRSVSNAMELHNRSVSNKILVSVNGNQHSSESVLLNLFRVKLNMSNKDIEAWFTDKLGIKLRIGKSSLRDYLRSVLKQDPQKMEKIILSEAYKEFGLAVGGDLDLRMYWDALDAQRHGDSNASIQK
jgi:hypothetical protein